MRTKRKSTPLSVRSACWIRRKAINWLRENPSDYGHSTHKIASELGCLYDDKKTRARVGAALRTLAETPDVERCDRSGNKARWRFVSFEEREARADAKAKGAADKGMAQILVTYLDKHDVNASVRSTGPTRYAVLIDPNDLYRFLKENVEKESI
jgi:hypothetical protein